MAYHGNVYRNRGDQLDADKIVCETRKVNSLRLIRMTGGHRGTQIVMSKRTRCIIEEPFTIK
jgi:hypothetical protein